MISICIIQSNFLSSLSLLSLSLSLSLCVCVCVCVCVSLSLSDTLPSFQSRTFQEVSAAPVSKTSVFALQGLFQLYLEKD